MTLDHVPVEKPTRTKTALEFLCATVLDRVLEERQIEFVTIRPIPRSEAGRNWAVDTISTRPAISRRDRERAEQVLDRWRDRFDLAGA
jgi:hypothetical protein